jgi:hypothetical protein
MFISYDMGKNWELISYFPSYKVIDNSNKPFFVNENVIYQPYISTNSLYATENFFSQKGFLISKDGGILWKPAAYNFLDTHRISASYTSYIFDDKGQGVLIRNSYGENNARIYFTNDYAITFSEYKELNPVCEMQAISDDNILYMNGKYWMHFLYTDNKTKSYLTKYLGFNLQNKSIDSLVFDDTTKFYSNWIKTNNENIYTLNIQKKDYTDSIPYKYKKMDFYLTNSTNGGKNWADINEKIPFNIYLKENGYSAGYQNGFFKNNNLYFPYFDSTLYRYNLIQNKWDSVQFNRDYFAHINFSYSGNKFFINNSLFLTSLTFNTNSTIYYCPDIDNDLYNWKLIEMNNLLNNEISESNPIIIESAYSDNKNILLNVQEFINMNLSKRNIIKMYIKDSIMNVNELEKISSEKIYLYNYKPFPQPAKHSIKCIISWDIKYNIDEAEYSIYDYLGNRYSNIKITLDKTLSDLGTLNWDCSNFCPGLYFISVYFHSEILKIPVIII